MAEKSASPKELAGRVARTALRQFLDSGRTIDLRPPAPPRVSVLMLVYNRAEVTLACLQSLALGLNTTPFELIVVDNASADETGVLLDRVAGIKRVRNAANRGFPAAVNQAAALAEGEYLFLLNNDTEVLGRAIDAAVDLLDREPDVGVVGGRIVLLDGTLQEAGCEIWDDGWTHQYARGLDPDDPACTFRRDVDYCSAAALMVRRRVFADLGGLDEAFSPGYFEDPEFSARVWRAGWRIVYLPEMTIVHHENATSAGMFDVPEMCVRNHARFVARHADWLALQPHPHEFPPLFDRIANDTSLKTLIVSRLADLPALTRTVACAQRLDGFVTLAAVGASPGRRNATRAALPPTVEFVPLADAAGVPDFLRSRPGYYEVALLEDDPDAALRAELTRQRVRWAVRRGACFT